VAQAACDGEDTSPTEGRNSDRQEPPTAEDPRLQRVIQELFRAHARLPGGTAGAVRHEVQTGALVGGKSHIRKAIERRRQLQQLLAVATSPHRIAQRRSGSSMTCMPPCGRQVLLNRYRILGAHI